MLPGVGGVEPLPDPPVRRARSSSTAQEKTDLSSSSAQSGSLSVHSKNSLF